MRHLPMLLLAMATAGLVVGSCTVDASMATDRAGRIVGVQAVRVASTLKRITIALAVDCGGPVVELLWRSDPVARSGAAR